VSTTTNLDKVSLLDMHLEGDHVAIVIGLQVLPLASTSCWEGGRENEGRDKVPQGDLQLAVHANS